VAQFPEAHLQLVGRNPAAQVQALAGPTVEVTGTVEDLEPWYERTRVALAPLQAGGGSRLKILEALAAGRPVVATGIGAEGLEDLVGRGVVVEDDPARMAAVLVELLGDPQRCADLGRRGADAVAADHSWPAAVRPLLAELAAGPSGPSRPPRRPQVLVVENSLRENGGLRVSLEHARRFVAAGAPTTVAVIQDASDGALYAPDPSLRVDMLTPRGSRFRTAAPLALARLLVRARRADVVVAGSEVGNALLLGFLAARLVHRPFAVLVQAELDDAIDAWVPGPLRGLTRRVHARVDAAVCVAETLVPGVVANGLARERVHVAVNGIDVARVRARAGLPPSPGEDGYRHDAAAPGPVPVVMANGRLAAAKDFPLLVRAHARVLDAGVDHRLVIMGEGPERALVEATVAELAVDATVTLPGFVREPYAPIAGADLFVLSSRSEGLPLTLLEALAVGAPVISTRCGTGPDLILDGGRYGDLVPVGDLDALAAAIERHLRDPRPLRDKARHGPSRAWEFDAGHAAATVLAVLTSLTDRPGTGRGAPG
jgi:glycosyltransferase involved in cell wall biosynthesis